MIGRVALLITFKKAKPKSQSLSRSHIRDLAHIEKMKLITYLTLCFIVVSCSDNIDPEQYLNKMEIKTNGDYTILNENYSPAIGDLLVEFDLKLEQGEYENIVNQIENHPDFVLLDSLEQYPSGHSQTNSVERVEFSCKRINTYYRHLFIPNKSGYEDYTFYVSKDSILRFQYADE